MDAFDGQEIICGHFFHVQCLKKWEQTCGQRNMQVTCPLCRCHKMTPVIHIDTPSKLENHENRGTKRKEEEASSSKRIKWTEDNDGKIHIEDSDTDFEPN